MTDRDTLYRGCSHAAWGYLFLNLDINLGTVSILPRFVGYLLFRAAIDELKESRRDLGLLRPLAAAMALWYGGDWLLSWGGGDLDGRVLFLDILVGVVGIYFQFQFLTDMAALAEASQPPGMDLDRRILRWRTVETVLLTALSFFVYVPESLGDIRALLAGALAVVYVIVGLCLMGAMFALRKLFQPLSLGEGG